jgi:hypothetical protein
MLKHKPKTKLKKTKKRNVRKHHGGNPTQTNNNNNNKTKITKQTIDEFIQKVSDYNPHDTKNNVDTICRDIKFVKLFNNNTQCEILFLNLLAKTTIVKQIIQLTEEQQPNTKEQQPDINSITQYIEQNYCKNRQTNIKVHQNIQDIVTKIYENLLSYDTIIDVLKPHKSDKTDIKQYKEDFIEQLTLQKEKYNNLMLDIINIYFSIHPDTTPELCDIVQSIFNLLRFVSLLIIQTNTDIDTNTKIKFNSNVNKETIQLILEQAYSKLQLQLTSFEEKINSTKQKGGKLPSIGKQIVIRPLAAIVLLPLVIFNVFTQGFVNLISFAAAVPSNIATSGQLTYYERFFRIRRKIYGNSVLNTIFYKKFQRSLFELALTSWSKSEDNITSKIIDTIKMSLIYGSRPINIRINDIIKYIHTLIDELDLQTQINVVFNIINHHSQNWNIFEYQHNNLLFNIIIVQIFKVFTTNPQNLVKSKEIIDIWRIKLLNMSLLSRDPILEEIKTQMLNANELYNKDLNDYTITLGINNTRQRSNFITSVNKHIIELIQKFIIVNARYIIASNNAIKNANLADFQVPPIPYDLSEGPPPYNTYLVDEDTGPPPAYNNNNPPPSYNVRNSNVISSVV